VAPCAAPQVPALFTVETLHSPPHGESGL
jgi:hypothetical protein